MDLYSQIMTIQINDKEVEEHFTKEAYSGYKVGRHEMRSDAAELALKADARIEKLEGMLKRAYDMEYIDGEWIDDYHNLMEDK